MARSPEAPVLCQRDLKHRGRTGAESRVLDLVALRRQILLSLSSGSPEPRKKKAPSVPLMTPSPSAKTTVREKRCLELPAVQFLGGRAAQQRVLTPPRCLAVVFAPWARSSNASIHAPPCKSVNTFCEPSGTRWGPQVNLSPASATLKAAFKASDECRHSCRLSTAPRKVSNQKAALRWAQDRAACRKDVVPTCTSA
jgi:hypothetical protein